MTDQDQTSPEVQEAAAPIPEVAMQESSPADGAVESKAAPVSPSFFVDESDRIRIAIDVIYDKDTGRPTGVSKTDIGIDFKEFEYLSHSEEWFEFSLPTYEDVTTYKQRSSTFRRDANGMVLDKIQFRNFLVVWHLKDWSLRDRKGEKVPLVHEKNGCLHDDSIAVVMKVPTGIMDLVLSQFEKDMMLN